MPIYRKNREVNTLYLKSLWPYYTIGSVDNIAKWTARSRQPQANLGNEQIHAQSRAICSDFVHGLSRSHLSAAAKAKLYRFLSYSMIQHRSEQPQQQFRRRRCYSCIGVLVQSIFCLWVVKCYDANISGVAYFNTRRSIRLFHLWTLELYWPSGSTYL